MARSRLWIAAPIALVCALGIAAVRADIFEQDQGGGPPQPTDKHKELLAGVGEWKGTLQSFMPGMPEDKMPASQTVEAVGGFWTYTKFRCKFMGMEYLGTGHSGYDVAKKKYVGTWADNMSSWLSIMEGQKDPKTGKIVMRWKAPNMAGKVEQHRSETTQTKDTMRMDFYVGEGAGKKQMTIEMKRVKKADAKPAKKG